MLVARRTMNVVVGTVLIAASAAGVLVTATASGDDPSRTSREVRERAVRSEARSDAQEAAALRTIGVTTASTEWPFGEVPLAYGAKIPAETVNALLQQCGCPLLPDTGPASPARVEAAWTNSIGDIVLQYDHGVQMSFEAGWEDETHQNWMSDMPEAIAEQGWGRILPARGLEIFGRERDEGQLGVVAVLHWLEGTRFISVGGHGGESLAELVEFAESLPHCDGCQARS